MPLYVSSLKCKNFEKEGFDMREADQIGFLMVGLGMREIKKNNIEEMVFRYVFLQKMALYRADKEHTASDARKIFTKYEGLQINNKQITRHRFMVNCARALERDILSDVRKQPMAA